jgi:hypothetical protein
MQPKTPITDMRPYKVFGICGIIGIILFLLLTNFMGAVVIFSGIETIIDLPNSYKFLEYQIQLFRPALSLRTFFEVVYFYNHYFPHG